MNEGDTLAGLHDIVTPEPVAWWPQTLGWGIAAAVLLAIAGWALAQAWRRRQANRYRQAALEELRGISERAATDVGTLAAVAPLLKRTALAAWPRGEVAALSGEAWLRFLDDSYGGNGFSQGPGRLLPRLSYAVPGDLPASDVSELLALSRHWIRSHRRPTGPEGVA